MTSRREMKHTAIRLPVIMWKALETAADTEVSTPTGIIRRAIDFYLQEKHSINYREFRTENDIEDQG